MQLVYSVWFHVSVNKKYNERIMDLRANNVKYVMERNNIHTNNIQNGS